MYHWYTTVDTKSYNQKVLEFTQKSVLIRLVKDLSCYGVVCEFLFSSCNRYGFLLCFVPYDSFSGAEPRKVTHYV